MTDGLGHHNFTVGNLAVELEAVDDPIRRGDQVCHFFCFVGRQVQYLHAAAGDFSRMVVPHLICVGHKDEAIAEARCAQTLDPVSLPAGTNLAVILSFAGHFTEAVEVSLKVLEVDPSFARAYEDLGRAYEQLRMYSQAIAAFAKAVECSGRSSRDLASLAYSFAIAGKQKEALKLLQEIKGLSRKSYVSPFSFALVFTGLGNQREALAWLEKAYKACDGAIPFIRENPRLAPLHSDSRFRDLVRRMNFPA